VTTAGVLARYLRPEGARLAALAIFLVLTTAAPLAAPQLLGRFIDMALHRGPLIVLYELAGGFIGLAILGQLLQIGATYYSEQLAWAATNRLRSDLAAHTLHLDMSYHTATSPGDLIERVDGDVAALANFFSQFVLQILGGALTLVGIFAIVMTQDWRIGAVLLAAGVAIGINVYLMRDFARTQWERVRNAFSAFSAFLEERIAGLEDIRANGGGAHAMRRFAEINRELATANIIASRRGILIYLFSTGLFSIGLAAAWAVGVSLFLTHTGSAGWRGLFAAKAPEIGDLVKFMQYGAMMYQPIIAIGTQLQQFQVAQASLVRIRALLAVETTLVDGPGVGWDALRKAPPKVAFEELSFAYRADAPVLRNVSLALEPGTVLGLLGRTGSGKTTLTRLLFRLYEPVLGRITFDGADIRDASLAELRGRIGLVTQDVQLFDASVRDNATLFDPTVPDARIIEVLTDLGLGVWLARQPQGLNTILRAGGGLSAGEAQLLAFTRVFLKDPGLVVLDEASSRLDPASDRLIERALDKLLGDGADGGAKRTAIIIAHKLSTVDRADRIAILDHGELLETGPRAALAADQGSVFARLLATGTEEVLA
jgi:ATP-binding cassette subfamily B protein